MTTWILIFYIGMPSGGGTSSAVFHSKESCEKAAKTIESKSGFLESTQAFCFEDNDQGNYSVTEFHLGPDERPVEKEMGKPPERHHPF